MPDAYEIATDGISKAEFRLGEDGQVRELGLLVEPEMGDAKIWFKRAGAKHGGGRKAMFKAGSSAANTESYQGANGAGGQRRLISMFGKDLAPLFS